MPSELTRELDSLCVKVERTFRGVLCAYTGFARPRVPTEDNDIVLEIFFAPRGSTRAVARAVHDDTRRIWREHHVSVAVVTHYQADTLRYYMADVVALYSARGLGMFLDAGGLGCQTRSTPRFWAESASGGRHTGQLVMSCERTAPGWHGHTREVELRCESMFAESCESSVEACHA